MTPQTVNAVADLVMVIGAVSAMGGVLIGLELLGRIPCVRRAMMKVAGL